MSGVSRMLIYAIPAVWLSTQAGFNLHTVWIVSVFTILVQAVISYALLQREMRKKLSFAPATPAVATH